MREKFINKLMIFIKKNNKNTNEEQLEVIQYGLEAIYMTITKTIILFFIAFLLGILKELIIFLPFYILIRMFSFGLHAKTSTQCLISSSLIFLISTFICTYLNLHIYIRTLLGISSILAIYKWSPADTEKRPIVSKKRRQVYKTLSTIIAITFSFLSIFITNSFISNCLVISITVQSFMVCPYVYKLFKLPYNNYLNYLNYGLN